MGTRIGSMITCARKGDGSVDVNKVISVDIVSDSEGDSWDVSLGKNRPCIIGNIILRVRGFDVLSILESVKAAACL